VRDPRPDTSYYTPITGSRIIQWGWNPVGGARSIDFGLTPNDLIGRASVGTVTILTS